MVQQIDQLPRLIDPYCKPTELEDLLERHCSFWHRSPVDRPLLDVRPWQAHKFYEPFPLVNGSSVRERTFLTPGLIDTKTYLERTRPHGLITGDFLRIWELYDVCWMEAMLGCRVMAATGTTWAEPFITDWSDVSLLLDREPTSWLEEFAEAHELLARMANSAIPVGQPLMRGPSDMALAVLGPELFCEGFYDCSDEMAALLEACARIWLEAANRRFQAVQAFRGGYFGRHYWGLWTPGRVLDFQEDATGLLSPESYHTYVAPIDRNMAQQYDYSIIHLHSGQLQMLPVMLDIPELTAIQILIDPPPYSRPTDTLISQFQAVHEAGKSLLVVGPVTRRELERILGELSPVGLAVRIDLLPND